MIFMVPSNPYHSMILTVSIIMDRQTFSKPDGKIQFLNIYIYIKYISNKN